MTTENVFFDCEEAIHTTDIDYLEKEIGYELPASFRVHYLKYNGGIPERTYCYNETMFEPMEIAAFKAMAKENDSSVPSILSTYKLMLEKQVIPIHLLPFANDWGGNFFCLNLITGAISFFATDSFYEELSPAENQAKAEVQVGTNFGSFIIELIDENEFEEE
ncbi:SMI1/KNR4 family protein [Flavobacterium sp. '19STA2R22 D10 B1']|uniref:SMI1/KNR4 family protein n=1 Tax=Flavobacterium aerium TaxID=3037261 RepID=UPI00278C6951|nr:SMI1/KNR4 family protein [Flavobacterium sp. '19STA2R22 D10 B1']